MTPAELAKAQAIIAGVDALFQAGTLTKAAYVKASDALEKAVPSDAFESSELFESLAVYALDPTWLD